MLSHSDAPNAISILTASLWAASTPDAFSKQHYQAHADHCHSLDSRLVIKEVEIEPISGGVCSNVQFRPKMKEEVRKDVKLLHWRDALPPLDSYQSQHCD